MTSNPAGAGRALVAGHGTFASGIIAAAAAITGRDDMFIALSNAGHGAADIERMIREHVDERGVELIFTDLPAGSCTLAARRVIRDRPQLLLVTGANLAALLDFALHAGRSPGEAARHAVERAREAIGVFGGQAGTPTPPKDGGTAR